MTNLNARRAAYAAISEDIRRAAEATQEFANAENAANVKEARLLDTQSNEQFSASVRECIALLKELYTTQAKMASTDQNSTEYANLSARAQELQQRLLAYEGLTRAAEGAAGAESAYAVASRDAAVASARANAESAQQDSVLTVTKQKYEELTAAVNRYNAAKKTGDVNSATNANEQINALQGYFNNLASQLSSGSLG